MPRIQHQFPNQTEMQSAARRIADVGSLSYEPYQPVSGETWAAELDGLFVVVDSLGFEVRLSVSRDIRKTSLEGLKFTMETPRTWAVLDGPVARDIRARVLLRHAAAGTFVAPGCGCDLERFRSELLEPVVLEVA